MLLDPFGNSISATDVYGAAVDGQAWALANGQWYWTTTPTPNAANVINQPATKKSSKTSKSKTAKTSGSAKTAKTSASGDSARLASDQSAATNSTPVHLWTLALVAGLALLYGAYEYRADLANRIHQFKSYFSARGVSGLQAARRRDD